MIDDVRDAVLGDVIDGAIDEARRRLALAERDLSGPVEHFAATLRTLCDDWGLQVQGWFVDGVGTPVLAVTRTDATGATGGTDGAARTEGSVDAEVADGIRSSDAGDGQEGIGGIQSRDGLDRNAAVLKLSDPGSLDVEARVMRAADGHGYARVLAWDPARGALLTERLGDSLWSESRHVAQQAELVLPLLEQAWAVPLPLGLRGLGKGTSRAGILSGLGERYGGAHREALALARTYAAGLAATEQAEVVCHGDPHPGNVMRRGPGWALIDPDGFVGERAYDVGVTLRDACWEVFAAEQAQPGSAASWLRDECDGLADRAEVDRERVWRWAFVERVSTGLFLHWHGHAQEAQTFLGSASLLARAAP